MFYQPRGVTPHNLPRDPLHGNNQRSQAVHDTEIVAIPVTCTHAHNYSGIIMVAPFGPVRLHGTIGWISTRDAEGQASLAPYSQFNSLAYDPPYVMLSLARIIVVNAGSTGHFVCNLATSDLRHAVVPKTSSSKRG